MHENSFSNEVTVDLFDSTYSPEYLLPFSTKIPALKLCPTVDVIKLFLEEIWKI